MLMLLSCLNLTVFLALEAVLLAIVSPRNIHGLSQISHVGIKQLLFTEGHGIHVQCVTRRVYRVVETGWLSLVYSIKTC